MGGLLWPAAVDWVRGHAAASAQQQQQQCHPGIAREPPALAPQWPAALWQPTKTLALGKYRRTGRLGRHHLIQRRGDVCIKVTSSHPSIFRALISSCATSQPAVSSKSLILHHPTDTMAQKAKKDRAKSNTVALNNLHIGAAVINVLFLLFHFLLRERSLLAYGLLSAPAFICEYVLEFSGRPKYDPATKALRSAGEDMAAPGLTEYMFDVIWVTWASVVAVMLFGNWGWVLFATVPAYGLYLGKGLLGMGRQQMAQMQGAGDEPAPQGNRRSRRAA